MTSPKKIMTRKLNLCTTRELNIHGLGFYENMETKNTIIILL